jgi:hypothetical protein
VASLTNSRDCGFFHRAILLSTSMGEVERPPISFSVPLPLCASAAPEWRPSPAAPAATPSSALLVMNARRFRSTGVSRPSSRSRYDRLADFRISFFMSNFSFVFYWVVVLKTLTYAYQSRTSGKCGSRQKPDKDSGKPNGSHQQPFGGGQSVDRDENAQTPRADRLRHCRPAEKKSDPPSPIPLDSAMRPRPRSTKKSAPAGRPPTRGRQLFRVTAFYNK